MTRIRIGFGTAVVATAVLFFLSGSYFTAGVFNYRNFIACGLTFLFTS